MLQLSKNQTLAAIACAGVAFGAVSWTRLFRAGSRKYAYAIIVHGGAYDIPDNISAASRTGCEAACRAGAAVLVGGGSALDAVEAAVRVLEDDPVFDAGHGSVLNEVGDIEMDAIIMNGSDLNTGAVAGVKNVRNPVSLARTIMERTSHTLFAGEGANKLADKFGLEKVGKAELCTPAAVAEWERFKLYDTTVDTLFNSPSGHDTVGACAVDVHGHYAAATSTGGITAKKQGRVGDAPLVGCGAYADDNAGAVSCTGHGESISKVTLARRVVQNLSQTRGIRALFSGNSPDIAGTEAIGYMKDRVGGHGGVIFITPSGEAGKAFSTARMAWASVEGSAYMPFSYVYPRQKQASGVEPWHV